MQLRYGLQAQRHSLGRALLSRAQLVSANYLSSKSLHRLDLTLDEGTNEKQAFYVVYVVRN